jgi:hypothetical protein
LRMVANSMIKRAGAASGEHGERAGSCAACRGACLWWGQAAPSAEVQILSRIFRAMPRVSRGEEYNSAPIRSVDRPQEMSLWSVPLSVPFKHRVTQHSLLCRRACSAGGQKSLSLFCLIPVWSLVPV